ncbi:MAG: AI-2E family transporter [Alphaproteobacteria bacterium]|nr:AI-2E family transporter [Alphaproteobacteria bacterium]
MENKKEITQQRYILILSVLAGLVFLLYILRSVLLPFVVGMAVAYFLDPSVNKLASRKKISRNMATILIMWLFLLVLLPLIVILGSAALAQVGQFLGNLPQHLSGFGTKLQQWLHQLQEYLPMLSLENVEMALQENFGDSFKPILKLVRGVVSNGFAVVNVLSLLLISPVVAFYMLRDWPDFIGKLLSLVPKKHKQTVIDGAKQVNSIIAGYLRGQVLVCVALGSFYSLGLWLVGLDLGLVVGFLAGLISFIPYVGSISGFLMAMILVVTQYGTLPKIAAVIAVFAIGQFLEGNFLTPKLVGENIGLHPVWVMFSLLAGGALLGLLGMIIAVPVAACMGVFLRYLINQYKQSQLYLEK